MTISSSQRLAVGLFLMVGVSGCVAPRAEQTKAGNLRADGPAIVALIKERYSFPDLTVTDLGFSSGNVACAVLRRPGKRSHVAYVWRARDGRLRVAAGVMVPEPDNWEDPMLRSGSDFRAANCAKAGISLPAV